MRILTVVALLLVFVGGAVAGLSGSDMIYIGMTVDKWNGLDQAKRDQINGFFEQFLPSGTNFEMVRCYKHTPSGKTVQFARFEAGAFVLKKRANKVTKAKIAAVVAQLADAGIRLGWTKDFPAFLVDNDIVIIEDPTPPM